jgi:hypothetical protein
VSGDLYEASYGPFIKILGTILRDVPLSIPVNEAAWMVFRAAKEAGFSPSPPPPDVEEVRRRIRALVKVLVRGLDETAPVTGAARKERAVPLRQ